MKMFRTINATALQSWLVQRGRTVLLTLAALAAIVALGRAGLLVLDQPLSTELITAQELQPNQAAFQAFQISIDRARARANLPLPSLRDPFAQP